MRVHAAATLDVPPAYAEFLGRRSFRPDVEPALAGPPFIVSCCRRTLFRATMFLCDAKFGNLLLYEGNAFRVAAMHGAPPGMGGIAAPRSNSPFWSEESLCPHCQDPAGAAHR